QFLVSFGLSAALRADLSSLCPSDCRPRFARTSVPCVLRTVGRASRGPQFLVSFGLSAALRADLSSLCPSDCRPRFARTSVPCVLRTVVHASRGPQWLHGTPDWGAHVHAPYGPELSSPPRYHWPWSH